MTVLHICSSYFETPLYKCLFSKLERLGVSNFIYVPRYHQDSEDDEKHLYVINKRFSKLSKLLYWGEQKYIFHDIEKRINLSDINFIHVHRILYGGYVALQLKKKYGIPYIVAIRYSDLYGRGRNMSIHKKHCLEIMLNAEKVIFLSNAYKENVWHRYSNMPALQQITERTEVITNGIDDYFLENIATTRRHHSSDNVIQVMAIGKIDSRKNPLTTMKACDLLIEKGYQVVFKLIGNICDKDIFSNIQKKTYTHYLGELNKEQVRAQLQETDILIVPSVHETFGLVYAEAMSQGVPVIYTKGQGFDGQYEDGEVGYPVNCFDAQEIAQRILDIMSNYSGISNHCIENAKNYSWETIANKYWGIYQDAACISKNI